MTADEHVCGPWSSCDAACMERSYREYDRVEQAVADGKLCPIDGLDHEWDERTDWMGDPSVPNGTVSWTVKYCRKCGDER